MVGPVEESSLPDHLETHLGTIGRGFSCDGLTVAEFPTPPTLSGCRAYSTLGMSHHGLTSRVNDRPVQLEFVMLGRTEQCPGPIPSVLCDVSEETIASHNAVLRGDVIGPRGPIATGSEMEALYATNPVYLPDAFASVGTVAIVWLVPISRAEANLVVDRGWDVFESVLVREDPDLTNLHRSSVA